MNKTARMFGSSKLRSGTAIVANGMPQITSRATKCIRSGRARGNVVPLNFASMSFKSRRRSDTSTSRAAARSRYAWPRPTVMNHFNVHGPEPLGGGCNRSLSEAPQISSVAITVGGLSLPVAASSPATGDVASMFAVPSIRKPRALFRKGSPLRWGRLPRFVTESSSTMDFSCRNFGTGNLLLRASGAREKRRVPRRAFGAPPDAFAGQVVTSTL